MKKIIMVFLMLSLVLTGCSPNKDDDKVTTENEVNQDNDLKSEDTNDKYYFDGKTAEIQDIKIEITDTKIIQPGDEGNEYGEKPIFAIWYDATNKSDKELDAGTAWIVIFDMIQFM